MTGETTARMIDRWFPVSAVDEACGTPTGSGRVEKAIFTWFASRPIAQARAAVLTSLLPDTPVIKSLIDAAVRHGDRDAMAKLVSLVVNTYGGTPPVVLDMFSGRAIIPLEAGRAGATAIGIDLSPVATLAGRLLADYPARDWSSEPPLPFTPPRETTGLDLGDDSGGRLAGDIASVLAEVDRRVAAAMEPYDGRKKKGKTARCPFCGQIHGLETVKAKGDAQEFKDALIAVADTEPSGRRYFRLPTSAERSSAEGVVVPEGNTGPYSKVPNEKIPPGNVHTVMASGYGYRAFGDLMCPRQTLSFTTTVDFIREVTREMGAAGISSEYARALASYSASVLCKRLRRSTRGVRVLQHGAADGSRRSYEQASDLFSSEAVVIFQFDFFEAGPGNGAGTWLSVSNSAVQAVQKVLKDRPPGRVRLQRASATALPLRDASVDVVITDPPYYDMVEYADASDLFHVWLKRVLFDIEPELFGPDAQQVDGLQDKNQEIIVRRVHEPNRVRHDTEFYEAMLAKSFGEARRVLKADGHLVVVFGHSDPDAWRRLLGALQTAGFVVTSAWPSRTESANTGVASIKVTVAIGCRVAPIERPVGLSSEVDLEVATAVRERVPQWDADGLALEDQLMASYGPAMEVYGRYRRVINPDGSDTDLDRYLTIARRAVRDAMRLRVDEIPLETFDVITRFAIFWLRAKGRSDVPKGEARFFAQADELRLDDLRERILVESKGGFTLRLDSPGPITPTSSAFEVVRAMVCAWDEGATESVAGVIANAGRDATDQHLWAVVGDLAGHLPAADPIAKALAGIKRTSGTIATLVGNVRETSAESANMQRGLFGEAEE